MRDFLDSDENTAAHPLLQPKHLKETMKKISGMTEDDELNLKAFLAFCANFGEPEDTETEGEKTNLLREKCDAMFDMVDRDGDGLINYDEASWLADATDSSLAAEEWTQICEALGNGVVDEKITKDLFWKMYDEMHAGDVDEHYSKVVANLEASQSASENQGASEAEVEQDVSSNAVNQESHLASEQEEYLPAMARTGFRPKEQEEEPPLRG